jgi:hypothetical protein
VERERIDGNEDDSGIRIKRKKPIEKSEKALK